MNWRKILLAAAGAGLAGTVGSWSHDVMAGVHHPFTAGSILVPVIPTLVAVIAALFTKRPQDK